MLLTDRINYLEKQIIDLQNKIADLSKNTENKTTQPITIAGGIQSRGLLSPIDIDTGLGSIMGNAVIWNNEESDYPPINAEVPIPDEVTGKGYNKHTHSRFSGGALINNCLEIVEYDPTDWALISNPHSQQFWQIKPKIKTTVTTDDSHRTVKMIGPLALTFNPDAGTDSNGNPIGIWGVATLEIDVRKCNFVQRRTEDGDGQKAGDIQNDSKGNPMQGALWNENQTKTSIVWDEDGSCWRLYSVYSPGTEDGT